MMAQRAISAIQLPSPNHEPRRDGKQPRFIILHYTGMADGPSAIALLRDPAPPPPFNKVSAHYVVEEAGQVLALVPEDRRAWHAGLACWRGERDLNSASIGIEIVNGGHDFGLPAYPSAQIQAVIALVADIRARWGIAPADVVGHSDIAPARKADPGEHFDWLALETAGQALSVPRQGLDLRGDLPLTLDVGQRQLVCQLLAQIGYDLGLDQAQPAASVDDAALRAVWLAFMRRWGAGIVQDWPHSLDALALLEAVARASAAHEAATA